MKWCKEQSKFNRVIQCLINLIACFWTAGGNPRRQMMNMQTLHNKATVLISGLHVFPVSWWMLLSLVRHGVIASHRTHVDCMGSSMFLHSSHSSKSLWSMFEGAGGGCFAHISTSPPYPQKVPAVPPARSPYFSFRSEKKQDFPGNVISGGCDSQPLVFAFTSKQHDSRLGYALSFLYIRSHRSLGSSSQ